MSWNSAGEFFAMGGYAFYVWGSYGVAALCIAGELWWLSHRRRSLRSRGAATLQTSVRQP